MIPVLGQALGAVRLLRLLRRHDEDGVLPTVGFIQVHQMHLLRLLHIHLCRVGVGGESEMGSQS